MRQVIHAVQFFFAVLLSLSFIAAHGSAAESNVGDSKNNLTVYLFGVISESPYQPSNGVVGRMVHKDREYEFFPVPIAVISAADIVQPAEPGGQQVVVRLPPGCRVSPRGFSEFDRIAYVTYNQKRKTLVIRSIAKLVGADQIKDQLSVPASVFSTNDETPPNPQPPTAP